MPSSPTPFRIFWIRPWFLLEWTSWGGPISQLSTLPLVVCLFVTCCSCCCSFSFFFFFFTFSSESFFLLFSYCATLLFFRTLLASQCRKIKRKSRYQGTRFALRIKIIHLCGLFAKHAQKFYCLTQRHRWRPRVSCLWGDRDDHMETTNRPSRPDHLEIFWNDWGDRDDPDDHPGLNWGNFGNFALRASENVVNLFSLKGTATKPKLSLWSEVNAIGNSKDLLSKLCVLNGQNWQTNSRSRDTAKMLELTATTSGLCKLCGERLSWLPVDVFLAAVQVCLSSLILSTAKQLVDDFSKPFSCNEQTIFQTFTKFIYNFVCFLP